MDNVILLPEGLMVETVLDKKAIAKVVHPSGIKHIVPYLHHSMIIDEECTLEDFMRLFYWDDPTSLHSLEVFLSIPMYEYLEESKLPLNDHDRYPYELMGLEIKNHTERVTIEDSHLQPYSIYRWCAGLGILDENKETDFLIQNPSFNANKDDLTVFDVGLVPVNNLMMLPLRYNNTLVFMDEDDEILFKTDLDITFMEIIQSIFGMFSEVGDIETRNKIAEDLTTDFINPEDEEENYEY